MSFNNRNDNFGDQLIFSLLYREVEKYDTVHILNSRPLILNHIPLIRIRHALSLAIKARLTGEKVILLDPPCARLATKFSNKSVTDRVRKALVSYLWRILGAKRYVIGISVAPDLASNTFNDYTVIGLRDHVSLRQIKSIYPQAIFCPDMACLMDVKNRPNQTDGKVLISFREELKESSDNNVKPDIIKNALTILINKFESIKKEQVDFYAQVEEDIEYNKVLSTNLTNKKQVIVSTAKDHTYYEKLFQDYSLVISNRLHVLLPAMMEGVMVIALVSKHHRKIIDLFSSYGLADNLIFMEDVIDLNDFSFMEKDDSEYRRSILVKNYQALSELNKNLKKLIKSYFDIKQ